MLCVGLIGVLGQAGAGGGGNVGDVVLWLVILVVCCIILGVALMRMRRHFLAEDDGAGEGAVLPMSELRRMRDSGELSDEEYRRAVDVLATRAKAAGPSVRPERAGNKASGTSPD